MRIEPEQLKILMVSAGLVSEKKFDKATEAAEKEDKEIKDFLVDNNLVSPDDLSRLEAYALGIPFVELEEEDINPDILRVIPEPVSRERKAIAFRKNRRGVEVAMLDIESLEDIKFVERNRGLKILPRLTNVQSIERALSQYQEELQKEFKEIIKEEANLLAQGEQSQRETRELAPNRIVEAILRRAVLQGASDVHIEPRKREVLVRYRINGVLSEAMSLPFAVKRAIIDRIKFLSNLDQKKRRFPQNGRFETNIDNRRYFCSVSIMPIFGGEKAVIQISGESGRGYSLRELGLEGMALEETERAIRKLKGVVLVAGPVNSGKTTTIYSMIDALSGPGVGISTIEDPIERRLAGASQTQVNPESGLTFAYGLRNILRQDPDVLMISELKDKETAVLAFNAASTGRLVVSSLLSDSAPEALCRLLKMGLDPLLLSSNLKLILGQRLVRRLAGGREDYKLKTAELKKISARFGLKRIEDILREENLLGKNQKINNVSFYRSKERAKPSEAYEGRIGVFEALKISEPLKEIIREKSKSEGLVPEEIRKISRKQGEISLLEDSLIKAAQGIISIDEALKMLDS